MPEPKARPGRERFYHVGCMSFEQWKAWAIPKAIANGSCQEPKIARLF